jgi:lipopolysaccharide/colanic/teichoic acid biosynthesis glycosyltransferase
MHQFKLSMTNGYLKTVWPFVKTNFILIGLSTFFIFGFQVFDFSRAIVFLTLLFIALLEFLSVTIYFVFTTPKNTDEISGSLIDTVCSSENGIIDNVVSYGFHQGEKVNVKFCDTARKGVFQEKLKCVYLNQFPGVYDFIDKNVNLSSIDIIKAEMLSSGNPYNVEILSEQSLHAFINLHELNDFRRINEYLIKVNKVLQDDGVFISKFQTKAYRHAHFLKKYPIYLAKILYFIDFIWKRVFPKLPFFQKFYFAATKGRNRALSLAEGLGRIVFCGFKITAMEYIDDWLYFVAVKVAEPSTDLTPSYSPIFKMKRTGRHGKPIYMYKIRTMHPYSEYIQDIATNAFGYGSKDKIKDDFRVTTWGKILRKYWLDEIPQLYNFLKGDLALVGVRPVSDTFLSTYPKDQMQERFKYKPGCIPPYVAYKMQSREEYIKAEKRYFTEKEKHPVWTDVKVFFLAVYNILTKKIQSE